jgi:serine/threonine protein kinase/tricorn protease-like protein
MLKQRICINNQPGNATKMKICPQCETGYHDSHTTCPTHGGLLSEIRDLRPGMLIRGTYRIKSKLGKGGMGSVYLAQQTLMDEPRALKFLSQDLSEDEAFTTRFLREVRTLRQVRNRNVVDCGDPERAEDGSLFFSMEFVDGPNLRDFLKTAPRPFDVKLALHITRGIAEGLGAAHAKGMVHRDIKPENILLAKDGDVWVPKIADFGIVATKESSHQTRTGSALLTMAYAAPEQWTGTRAADLDGRTDLYALGGVLFEMLTGQCVFDAENYHGWAQMHMHTEPPAPSRLRAELKKWKGLDALVLQLLSKERDARPQNVAELITLIDAVVYDPSLGQPATDPWAATVVYTLPPEQRVSAAPSRGTGANIQDAETSLPVPVKSQGTGSPAQLAATSLHVPASHTGLSAAPQSYPVPPVSVQPQPAAPSMRIPVESPAPSAAPQPVSVPLPPPERDRGNEEYGTLPARRTVAESRRTSATQTIHRTSSGATVRGPAVEEEGQGGKRKKGAPLSLWILVLAIIVVLGYAVPHYYVPKAKFRTLQNQTGPIESISLTADGRTLASASQDNSIQLWDMVGGKPLNSFSDHANAVAFNSDGRTIAAADTDNNVRLWDAPTGQVIATMAGHTEQVLCVVFSPDGHKLASGSADKTVRLWDATGDRSIRTLQGHTAEVRSVAFSPDGGRVASASADNTIKLWDVATGKLLRTLQGHGSAVNSVAFSPDGRTLASGSDDMTIKLWDVASGKNLRTLQGHTAAVRSVAFGPQGRRLVSGSADTTVRLWDVSLGSLLNTLQGHTAAVESVAFSPDGNTVASGSDDKTIKLWSLDSLGN